MRSPDIEYNEVVGNDVEYSETPILSLDALLTEALA